MATKKLADAYLELRADDSKLTGDVKVKATRVGKEFGGQLNRALKALDIDPVDVKADPKSALAAIAATRDRLRQMSNEAESVEMRIRTERALTQVERFRRQLDTVDDGAVTVRADVSPAQRQAEQLRRQLAALGVEPIDLDADPRAALAAIRRVDEELRRLSGDAATVHVRVDAESARASLARFRNMVGDIGTDAATGFAASFGGKVGPLMARLPLSPHLAAAAAIAAAAAAPGVAGVLSAAVVGAAGAGGIIGGVTVAARHKAVKSAAQLLADDFGRALEHAGVSFVPVVVDSIGDVRAEIYRMQDDLETAFSSVSVYVRPLTQDFLAGARRGVEGFATAVERSGPILTVIGGIAERAGDVVGDTFEGLSEHSVEASHALAALWVVFEYGIRSIAGTIEMLTAAYGWLEKFSAAVRGDVVELGRLVAEQEAAKGSSDGLSQGLQELLGGFNQNTTASATLTSQVRSLSQIMDEYTTGALDARQANRDYQAAIDAATASVKENGRTLDIGTAKGRANQQTLDDLVRTTQRKSAATFQMTQSQEKANAVTEQGKAAFIRAATAMGMEAGQARALAAQLFAIPNVDRSIRIRDEQAQAAIRRVQAAMGRVKDLRVGVYFDVKGNLKLPGGTQLKGLAGGGPVDDAPGPKGVDSRAYLLARGEHVFAADEVDRMGGQQAVLRFRRQLMAVSAPALSMPSTSLPLQKPVAMDSGGMLMPGWNPPIYNGTGRPEAVTTAASMDAVVARLDWLTDVVERRLTATIKAVQGIAPGVSQALTGAVEDAWVVEARLR